MRLIRLRANLYRSLREVVVEMNGLNLFIGASASGKSTVLDALRLLQEGARDREFGTAVRNRGGIINLPWKGEAADQTELVVEPAAVRIVQRDETGATSVGGQVDSDSIREALRQSGFGLGAFYETQGFAV